MLRSFFIILLFLGASPAFGDGLCGLTAEELDKSWMQGPLDESSASSIKKILSILETDQKSAELLEKTKKNLKLNHADELVDFIVLCPANLKENAKTLVEVSTIVHLHDTAEILKGLTNIPVLGSDEVLLSQENHLAYSKLNLLNVQPSQPISSNARSVGTPQICLKKSLSLRQAVLSLSHELVHLNSVSTEKPEEVLEYEGFDEYAKAKISEQGGESDAFIFEHELGLRLFGEKSLPKEFRFYFSLKDKKFVGSKSKWNQFLLTGSDYNYRDRQFAEDYADSLEAFKKGSAEELKVAKASEKRLQDFLLKNEQTLGADELANLKTAIKYTQERIEKIQSDQDLYKYRKENFNKPTKY